jgi:hypothetical protein
MLKRKAALTHNASVLVGIVLAVIANVMLMFKARTIPDIAPLAWLIPLAVYDMQKREVPHIAFVAMPCLLATLTATVRGDWMLATLAVVSVAASERHHLPEQFRRVAFILALVACTGLLIVTPFESLPGAIALIGFWMAYELGWWAGADALATMALVLLWPNIRLLAALAASHIVVALMMKRAFLPFIPRRLKPDELQAFGAPGLPAIALGATLFTFWNLL